MTLLKSDSKGINFRNNKLMNVTLNFLLIKESWKCISYAKPDIYANLEKNNAELCKKSK